MFTMHLKYAAALHLVATVGLISQPTSIVASTQNSAINNYARQTTDDSQQPIKLYQQALNHLLGKNGRDKSAEKAAAIFKILANKNWGPAQHMLGNMYYSGKGVEKNYLLAYKWFSLAIKDNPQLAKIINKKRRFLHYKLKKSLSGQSFYNLETWITEWKPSGTRTTYRLSSKP